MIQQLFLPLLQERDLNDMWLQQDGATAHTSRVFKDIKKPAFPNDLFPCDEIDEAHFWLNGYVNKQNCRIWSEANPQVYVETPLHPEKLTVWCALWAGGILQKR
ncbi:hypothetical protein TNCV_582471 [Trichonephila clavipes]|nr:hypothetical protein TNCV_582471 [Trichonephila clavipes]